MTQKKTHKATIQDVADQAGVSYITAARALSGSGKYPIHPDTRTRIEGAAKKIGYSANPFARSLATQRSHIIGLCGIIPAPDQPRMQSETYYFHIDPRVTGILRNPQASRYNVMIIPRSDESPNLESSLMEKIRYLDGLIYISPKKEQAPMLARIAKHIALVAENAQGLEEVNTVSVDQYKAIADAMRLLAQRGCKRIAMILTRDLDYYYNASRAAAFRETLRMLRLPWNKQLLEICHPLTNADMAYHAMARLLKRKPRIDGVIVPRDAELLAALEAIRDAGLAVGKDIKLVSVNETETARHMTPPMTAIQFPTEQVAGRAFVRLTEIMEGPPKRPVHDLMPATLIERASTGG